MTNWNFSIFPNETFIDLGLYQYGGEQCAPSYSFGPAARSHYLFHYILHGKGELHFDNDQGKNTVIKLKEGEGFMLFPHEVSLYVADNDDPWEYIWIEFDGLRVKEALDIVGLTKYQPIYRSQYSSLRDCMINSMITIIESQNETPFYLISHLYLFLDYLMKSIQPPIEKHTNRLTDFYMREATSFIEQNYNQNISIQNIADYLNLNRSYFGKLFKKETGKTPQEFLLNYRMIKACELLKKTDMRISEISKAVGYDNQLHFSRAFKNIYQISPLYYRKNKKR